MKAPSFIKYDGTGTSIFRIKIVPEENPNDDGVWVVLDPPVKHPATTKWIEVEEVLEPFIPEGHFLVAYD